MTDCYYFFFFFKQKTAYEILIGLVGSEMCIRDSDRLLGYHNTHEYRRGGDQLDQPAHMAMIAEQVDHNINSGEATFDWWLRP